MQVYTIGTGKVKHEIGVELTEAEAKLHAKAIRASRVYLDDEAHLCEVLREVSESSLFIKLGYSSLFNFAVHELGLSESVAGSMNTVARNCARVPELREAIRSQRLTVSKASRIVSSLKPDNAVELIEYAATHSTKEIDREMARRNPERGNRDQVRPVNESDFEIRARVCAEVHDLMKRAESIVASKGKSTKLDSVLREVLEVYLDRHDPVRRAERAVARKNKKGAAKTKSPDGQSSSRNRRAPDTDERLHANDPCLIRDGIAIEQVQEQGSEQGQEHAVPYEHVIEVETREAIAKEANVIQQPTSKLTQAPTPIRKPAFARAKLKAAIRHEVIHRAGGRCTFMNDRGERCNESRYLQTHHIVPLNQGGSDEPSNLTCLCPNHHALVHQLSFAIDGQITWIRSVRSAYLA